MKKGQIIAADLTNNLNSGILEEASPEPLRLFATASATGKSHNENYVQVGLRLILTGELIEKKEKNELYRGKYEIQEEQY